MPRAKRQPIAVYRLRNAGSRARDPIGEVVVSDETIVVLDGDVGGEWDARAFIRTTDPDLPKWARFLSPGIDGLEQALRRRAANSLVLVLKRGRTRYALAFGHGRSLIESKYVERGFGLRCALALIDSGEMISADYKQVEHTTLFSKVQANNPISFDEFRIDTEAALVSGIFGRPADEHVYFSKVLGADALHVNPAITLAEVPALLDWVEDVRKKKDYLARGFDFVDHVSIVRDPSLEEKLCRKVDAALKGKARSVGVGLPEYIDHLEIDAFKLTGLRRKRLERISLADVKVALGTRAVVCSEIKTRKIRGINEDDEVMRTWSAFNWLTWSGKLSGETFHLQDGTFYKVDRTYENRIDRYLRRLEKLPDAWPDLAATSEAAWNAKLQQHFGTKAKLLDKKLFTKSFRGPGSIELCDVFLPGTPNWLICAKIYEGSAPLSHLFAQGANAIETLFSDEEFRREIRDKAALKARIKLSAPRKADVGLAYVVLTDGKRRALTSLPFFAKLTLYRYAKLLAAGGFRMCAGTRAMT